MLSLSTIMLSQCLCLNHPILSQFSITRAPNSRVETLVCANTHARAHPGMHTHAHTHRHALTRTHMFVLTRMYTHSHTHTHTHRHALTRTHMYVLTRMYTHAHTNTGMRSHVHTCTSSHVCTHTHTLTHTCADGCCPRQACVWRCVCVFVVCVGTEWYRCVFCSVCLACLLTYVPGRRPASVHAAPTPGS